MIVLDVILLFNFKHNLHLLFRSCFILFYCCCKFFCCYFCCYFTFFLIRYVKHSFKTSFLFFFLRWMLSISYLSTHSLHILSSYVFFKYNINDVLSQSALL